MSCQVQWCRTTVDPWHHNVSIEKQLFGGRRRIIKPGYRFYSPAIERWMNRDPLGEEGGVNLYGFVQNDPVNAIDPDGQILIAIPVILGGISGEAILGALTGTALAVAINESINQAQEKAQDRKNYKGRCRENPPPNLIDPCDIARWKLQRERDCKSLRQEFSNKWHDGPDARHANEIAKVDRAIQNLEKLIKENCCEK